jgi:hypothetical protein
MNTETKNLFIRVDAGIKIIYEKFQHPIYRQQYEEFVPNLSILDLLFNEGKNSIDILSSSKIF